MSAQSDNIVHQPSSSTTPLNKKPTAPIYTLDISPLPIPVEVFNTICSFLHGSHRMTSLLTLQRTCCIMYDILTPCIYKTYTIKSNDQFRLLLAPLVHPSKAHKRELDSTEDENEIRPKSFYLPSTPHERGRSARHRSLLVLSLVETLVFQIMPTENLMRIADHFCSPTDRYLFDNASIIKIYLTGLSKVLGAVQSPIRDVEMAEDEEHAFDSNRESELDFQFQFALSDAACENYSSFISTMAGAEKVFIIGEPTCDTLDFSRYNTRKYAPLVIESPQILSRIHRLLAYRDLKEITLENVHRDLVHVREGCHATIRFASCNCCNRVSDDTWDPEDVAELVAGSIVEVIEGYKQHMGRPSTTSWTIISDPEIADGTALQNEYLALISMKVMSQFPEQTFFPLYIEPSSGESILECVRFSTP